jgi:uncharacterized protein (TIGR03067 family)
MIRTTTLGIAALLLAGSATLTFAQAKPRDNASGAPTDLLGGYTVIAGERFGEPEPADRIEGVTVRFAEDAIVVLDKDKKEVYAQTYKVDTSSTPWKITMRSKITPYAEKSDGDAVAYGLVQKDGDTVKLIYALPGGEKPTEFKTKAKQLMFVMKNEKKSK